MKKFMVLTAIAMLAGADPAFAGRAVFLGSHTASDTQLDGTNGAEIGGLVVTYGTTINIAGMDNDDGLGVFRAPSSAFPGAGDFTLQYTISGERLPSEGDGIHLSMATDVADADVFMGLRRGDATNATGLFLQFLQETVGGASTALSLSMTSPRT